MTILHFRSNFFRLSAAASFVAVGLMWSASAHAAMPLTVTKDLPQSLGGDTPYLYTTVTIKDGGVLSVLPMGAQGGTGRLHIKANKIVIEPGGVLDASGAGHPGQTGSMGSGPGGGGYATGYSGGGGAFFGNGGAGTDPMCSTGIFGVGGKAYGVADGPFALGSAGGAGGKTPGPKGGNGGGSIILEAAEITVQGTINVSGANGFNINSVGAGGGAGGEIRLQASLFTWGPKAQLLAKGGDGGNATTESGGSGGGGLIWLRGGPTPPPEVVLNISAGVSPANCAAGIGKGADGLVVTDTAPFACRDLDGDGFGASLCGETDCDDADDKIHPMADDDCDGIDTNCNTKIDDSPAACAAGLVCINGNCESVATEDGGVGDGGTPAAPELLEYRGGCSVPTAPDGAAPLAALGAAIAFCVHATRRARRKSR